LAETLGFLGYLRLLTYFAPYRRYALRCAPPLASEKL
jgi:hypothetical protein